MSGEGVLGNARPIDTDTLGPITSLPNAADELAKAVDAIQAAEGALNRALPLLPEAGQIVMGQELAKLRTIRQRVLVARGGPKAEPVHFVGGAWRE